MPLEKGEKFGKLRMENACALASEVVPSAVLLRIRVFGRFQGSEW